MPKPAGRFDAGQARRAHLPEGYMGDIKDNAFIALYLGLTAVVTLGWVGVVGYGVWHFLFG